MGEVKVLILAIVLVILVSGCYTGPKTKAVVTDITGEAVKEKEPPKVQENIIKEEIENQTAENIETEEEKEEQPSENETEEQIKEETEKKTELKTWNVNIEDLKLNPKELTIGKGDIVVWSHKTTQWGDEEIIKVQLVTHIPEFRSPLLTTGDSFSHTFNKTGTFTYIDLFHKDREQMRGTVIVNEQ